MFFLERRGFPNKLNFFSLFLIVLSWTLTFNMLTEAFWVWDVALFMSTARSDLGVNLLECSLPGRLTTVSNVFTCKYSSSPKRVDSKFFGNCLITPSQIDRQRWLLVFDHCCCCSSLNCVNTHLNAPDQLTAQTSAFIEVLTLVDDQIINCTWLGAPGCCSPS